jgi:hypothetical protein
MDELGSMETVQVCHIFDVVLEADTKNQFRIEERSRYSTDSRMQYRDGDAAAIFKEDLRDD